MRSPSTRARDLLPDRRRHHHRVAARRRPSTPSRRSSSPTATSRGPPVGTPTRGTWSRRRWPSTSAAATRRPGPRTTGWPASSAPTAAGTPTTSATTSRTRRSTPTSPATSRPARGTTTSSPATPPTSAQQWPTVEAAIDFALDFQRETGEIAWRGDDPDDGALLTGSSSIHHSLKCALAIAERLGHERPDWELSLGGLAIAIAHRPDVFLDKDRWAMDWYYPILGGVLRGYPANARVAARWATFVVDGRGDPLRVGPPVGHRGRDVRAGDGARRRRQPRARRASCSRRCSSCAPTAAATGPAPTSTTTRSTSDGELYPVEQPTWNSAAVVLAANALAGTGPTAGLFRGERLPEGLNADELLAAGVEIEEERAPRALS